MLGLMSRLTQSMAHAQSAPRSLTSFLKLMDWYRCRCIYNMYLDVSEIRYLVRLRRLNQTNRLSNFIATPGRELRFLIKHQVSVDVVRPNKNFRCKVEASVGFFLWFIALSAQYWHVIILGNLCLSSGSSGLDKLFARVLFLWTLVYVSGGVVSADWHWTGWPFLWDVGRSKLLIIPLLVVVFAWTCRPHSQHKRQPPAWLLMSFIAKEPWILWAIFWRNYTIYACAGMVSACSTLTAKLSGMYVWAQFSKEAARFGMCDLNLCSFNTCWL